MPKLKHHLTEVKITSGKTICKVSRAFVVALPGDKIKFRNGTKAKVHVHVSDDKLFVSPMFAILPGHEKTWVVQKVRRGVYPYAVFSEQKARFCIGSSMPIIIVPR
jgi:hypothetical protein